MSTRRSRVELREHHSISHQVIKVVVFQLLTPSGLVLVHVQCLRSVYVANRLEVFHCKARDPHVEAWRVGCHLSRPPRHPTEVLNHMVFERKPVYAIPYPPPGVAPLQSLQDVPRNIYFVK
ncbi:hypothetical protein TNCV_3963411 [Trichonephila clavipes]|nr:hypothetical protein TNCV_3963411 [Trichonephila clavipes]